MIRKPAMAAALAVAWCALTISANAQNFSSPQNIPCGSSVTQSLTLRTDIGPCAQTALIIRADHVTVDLNGHRILGTGASGTSGIEIRAGMVTIQGSGLIQRFDIGIRVVVPSAWWVPRGSTIQHLRLDGNRIGIWIHPDPWAETFARTRIIHNTISGPGQVGIKIDYTSNTQIVHNSISGMDSYGIQTGVARYTEAGDNTVTNNSTGMMFDYWSDFPAITNNTVSDNRTDGIQSATRAALVEDNTVSRNGRDGMTLTQFLGVVHDNRVMNNGRRGIALGTVDIGGVGPVGPDTYHVTGNDARNNLVDLYWDGTGKNNCWADNSYRTASPGLTRCP